MGRQAEVRRYDIDIDRSRAPRAYRDKQNLWQDDIQRIYRLVARQVEELTEWEQRRERGVHSGGLDERDERPHLSIAIFGPSGSGKSSLIRTLADDVQRDRQQILAKELGNKISTLPVMDPTTWAPTDQFLYAFLAASLEEERNEQERKEHGYPQGLSPVQLAFQEVNEYLRVVDEPERSEEHDPLGLSLQKLERHTSGLRLRKALGVLIEELAKEFRSEVVLLPVDDLDMAPDHLVDALQSYQSFLTHPRLVPIFTFTDRLPEELIEVHYKNAMTEVTSHRRLAGINRLEISEQMAVQFLARCFPVRNRIRLGPAPARVQRAYYSSSASSANLGDQTEKAQVLELLTQSSFLLFGYPDGEDSHKIRASLRPSTLRRQFQVVDAMADCRLWSLRTPQFGVMSQLDVGSLLNSATNSPDSNSKFPLPLPADPAHGESEQEFAGREQAKKKWDRWREDPNQRRRLAEHWAKNRLRLAGESYEEGYQVLARSLRRLDIGATWATIFNGACWSLLNVHRDTLRELGLFLEDLYSWTPKELRSVVLENILAQDQVTRRTVVDRWFNRTDYRRSQVLSLLAANAFRPWMTGEEPYGDEEIPIRKQIGIESKMKAGSQLPPLDTAWNLEDGSERSSSPADKRVIVRQIQDRLTIPAPKGLLWFLNVTLGFYLPQIMARNWGEEFPVDTPLKSRMGGNGWDLNHAATNAVRIADAKQEVFSFGTLFVDPKAYRRVLQIPSKQEECEREGGEKAREWLDSFGDPQTEADEVYRRHLLLRLWSCCGFSSGRYWAAFSLWRGLSFIGQAIEIGLRHEDAFDGTPVRPVSKQQVEDAEKQVESAGGGPDAEEKREWAAKARVVYERYRPIMEDLSRLVRTHILQGLAPGSLLDRTSDVQRLLHGFPKWDPRDWKVSEAIDDLVLDLTWWLSQCWTDRIYPLPAGDIWIGWRDCFIRRIHGEYILGGLWPRLDSVYLEAHRRDDSWRLLGFRRTRNSLEEAKEVGSESELPESEKYQGSASLAAAGWSDFLFEYWRGSPPVLKMLLACPVMFKSHDRFGLEGEKQLGSSLDVLEKRSPSREERRDSPRLDWLHHLGLPPAVWKEIRGSWEKDSDPLGNLCMVPSELVLPRVQPADFIAPMESHHSIRNASGYASGKKTP